MLLPKEDIAASTLEIYALEIDVDQSKIVGLLTPSCVLTPHRNKCSVTIINKTTFSHVGLQVVKKKKNTPEGRANTGRGNRADHLLQGGFTLFKNNKRYTY